MNAVDIALGLIVVGSALRSVRRGLVRDGAVYLGLVMAIYLAGRSTGPLLRALPLAGDDPVVRLGAYLLVLVAGLAFAMLVASLLQPLARLQPFWLVDRFGGVAVGVGQGLLLCGLLLSAALQVSSDLVQPYLAESRIAPLATALLMAVLEWVPEEVVAW